MIAKIRAILRALAAALSRLFPHIHNSSLITYNSPAAEGGEGVAVEDFVRRAAAAGLVSAQVFSALAERDGVSVEALLGFAVRDGVAVHSAIIGGRMVTWTQSLDAREEIQ